MSVIASLDSTIKSSKKLGFSWIRKLVAFCEVRCMIGVSLMLPVKFAYMKHLNWFGMFMFLLQAHCSCCCYKQIAISGMSLPDKCISFLLRKIWLAPVCSSSAEIFNMLCQQFWREWEKLIWLALIKISCDTPSSFLLLPQCARLCCRSPLCLCSPNYQKWLPHLLALPVPRT